MGARVLLVEDDDDIRNMLGTALVRDGHLVFEATDGQTALDRYMSMLAADIPPDVVITDWQLPGRHGLAFIAAIRATGCRCPVLVTGFENPTLRHKAEVLDAEVIGKPFDLNALRARIAAVHDTRLAG